MSFQKPRYKTYREWTGEEEEKLLSQIRNGVPLKEIIPEFKARSVTSLENKIRKLKLKHDYFGGDRRLEKYLKTVEWLEKTEPNSVFEAFAGHGNLTRLYAQKCAEVHACEINAEKFEFLVRNIMDATAAPIKRIRFNGIKAARVLTRDKSILLVNADAQKWASYMYSRGKYFDFVDLDVCGTALPSLLLFLKLVKKGSIAVTLGEFHSYRLGRRDVLLKCAPILFNFGKKINLKKFSSAESFFNFLIGWACLNGAFSISYRELKLLTPLEKVRLGEKSNVMRVLFDVRRASSLAEILNMSSKYLSN